jgi:hypothetical protein
MTEDMAIRVLVRLRTALLALEAASAEALQPADARDPALLSPLLEALRLTTEAHALCEHRIFGAEAA